MNATFRPSATLPPVTHLRVGRPLLLVVVIGGLLLGGTLWLLNGKSPTLPAAMMESTAWPPWLKQAQTYPAPEPKPPVHTTAETDKTAAELAKLRTDLL